MAESPEKRPLISRRKLIAGGAAGTLLAYIAARTGRAPETKKMKAPDPETRIERTPLPRFFGMRRVLQEQVSKGDTISFGEREQAQVNADWMRYMKGPQGARAIAESQARLNEIYIDPKVAKDQKEQKETKEPKETKTNRELIEKAFADAKVDRKYMYIAFAETWFRSKTADGKPIRSKTGAIGAFQFQERAAIEYGLLEKRDGKITRDDRLDPVKSAGAAARYLKNFAAAFMQKGAPVVDAWDLAVLAYNGGYAQRYLSNGPTPTIAGFRSFLIGEMHKCLERIKKDRKVTVRAGDTLLRMSRRYGVSLRVLKNANPNIKDEQWKKLKANVTVVHVPGLDSAPFTGFVRPGETLTKLAERYGTTEQALKDLNNTIDWTKLQKGAEFEVPKDSKAYPAYVLRRKMAALGGYIENVDYLAKFKAILAAIGER